MRQCLRYAASTAVLLALASPALAVQDCKPAKADNRVCSVVFNPDDVVRVWGTLRSLTLFEFSPDEAVTKVSAADRNDLIVMPLQNTVILKPKPLPSAAWALQPIVIQTTRKDGSVRSYLIEYNLRDGGSLQAGDQYTQFAVKYTYPGDVAAAQAAAWRARQAGLQAAEAKKRLATTGPGAGFGGPGFACDYVEQHDPKHPVGFIPTRVCDDGQSTFMNFPGNMRVPTITLDGDDGQPIVPMQNFDTTGQFQVIHQVAKHFYLRIGGALVCIWKTGPISSTGYNPGTATSSRDVERVLKGDP
jgi:type IV secretion system protein VirB9